MKKDALGDRMKSYEAVTRSVLPPYTFTIIRIDGWAFHTFLRNAKKPFDRDVMHAMNEAAKALCDEINGAQFAYVQSDEISLLLRDGEPPSEAWFGGSIQKMCSLSASIATAVFNANYVQPRNPYQGISVEYPGPGTARFDARVYTIPDRTEVMNYFLWRQKDAIRNAVSMAAQAKFSQRELNGVSTEEMQEKLFQEHNINFKKAYTDGERRGWLIYKEAYGKVMTIPVRKLRKDRKKEAQEGPQVRHEEKTVVRMSWLATAAPEFRVWDGSDLSDLVPYNGAGPEPKALIRHLGYPMGKALMDTAAQDGGPLYAAERIRESFQDGALFRAWMIGMNPHLDDSAPIGELLTGEPERINNVLAAHRAYENGDFE